ncbi:hypothetical protein ASG90_20390 [Nocardioides sp. Soil797]|nr:hypothetical protein ASG90_20390 [Nocardioides sp. Soil797]
MLLCLAITVCVVAWGFLAYAAIDFGRSARGGESTSWAFLGLACVGAAACLFVAMILVGRLLRATGIIVDRTEPQTTPEPSRNQGPTNADTPTGVAPLSDDTAEVPKVPTVRYQGKRVAR